MKALKGQPWHQNLVLLLVACLSGILTSGLTGCATSARERLDERQSQGRVHPAGYAADGFTMDHRSPASRPFRAWDFYYKHCALVSRNPYPNRSEFECSEPR